MQCVAPTPTPVRTQHEYAAEKAKLLAFFSLSSAGSGGVSRIIELPAKRTRSRGRLSGSERVVMNATTAERAERVVPRGEDAVRPDLAASRIDR